MVGSARTMSPMHICVVRTFSWLIEHNVIHGNVAGRELRTAPSVNLSLQGL